jgi:hypothetical protein
MLVLYCAGNIYLVMNRPSHAYDLADDSIALWLNTGDTVMGASFWWYAVSDQPVTFVDEHRIMSANTNFFWNAVPDPIQGFDMSGAPGEDFSLLEDPETRVALVLDEIQPDVVILDEVVGCVQEVQPEALELVEQVQSACKPVETLLLEADAGIPYGLYQTIYICTWASQP